MACKGCVAGGLRGQRLDVSSQPACAGQRVARAGHPHRDHSQPRSLASSSRCLLARTSLSVPTHTKTHTHTHTHTHTRRNTKALEDARKRLAKAQKAQHAADVALAEARGKSQVGGRAGGRLQLGSMGLLSIRGWRRTSLSVNQSSWAARNVGLGSVLRGLCPQRHTPPRTPPALSLTELACLTASLAHLPAHPLPPRT
jgi:hypothetical protein